MTAPQPVDAIRATLATLAMVVVSTLAGLVVAPRWGTGSVDMLFLPAVLAAAALFGRGSALVAAGVSVLAYNYCFVPPVRSFRIDRPEDLVTVAVLLAVALVTSQLAAAMREQGRLAAAHATRNATIAGVARKLLSCATPQEIGVVATGEIGALFGCDAVLLSSDGTGFTTLARAPEGEALTPGDLAAAAIATATGEPAGRGAPRLSPADWLFYPVRTDRGSVAALGLAREDGAPPADAARLPLLTNLLDQVALALARAALEREMRDVGALRERDRLRSALLSSVGHDLRTPLTAIAAAAAELHADPANTDLLTTIEAEAGTLDRYIGNLLDMALVEAGSVRVRREPTDLVDAVAAALRDLRRRLVSHRPQIDLAADLPLVAADPDLLHHVLINLIDNAARHGGGEIAITGLRDGAGVVLAIADRGPGLPADGSAPFARFSEVTGSDRTGGAGLGLAIVKAFADAMSVSVEAENRRDGPGARFTLRFADAPATKEAADGGEPG